MEFSEGFVDRGSGHVSVIISRTFQITGQLFFSLCF